MSMQKSKVSKFGSTVVSSYHKVTSIVINTLDHSGTVVLASFANHAARVNNDSPIEVKVYKLPVGSFSTAAMQLSDPLAISYLFIKNNDSFFSSGVTNV